MKLLIFICMLLPLCNGYLHIEDLRKMVMNATERKQLQILAKEVVKPRDIVRQQVAIIANNQSDQIQRVYQLLVTIEALQEEANYELEMVVFHNIGVSNRVVDLRQRIRDVELDMSLSRKQAAEEIRDLKDEIRRALTRSDKSALDNLEIMS